MQQQRQQSTVEYHSDEDGSTGAEDDDTPSSSSGTSDCGECCAGHAPYPYTRRDKNGAAPADAGVAATSTTTGSSADDTSANVSRGTQISPSTVAEMYAAAAAKAAADGGQVLSSLSSPSHLTIQAPVKKKLSFHLNCDSDNSQSGIEDKCVQTPTGEEFPAFPMSTDNPGPGPSCTHSFSASGPPEGDACQGPPPKMSPPSNISSSPSKGFLRHLSVSKTNGDAANEIERVSAAEEGPDTSTLERSMDGGGGTTSGSGGLAGSLGMRGAQREIMRKIGKRIRFRKKKDKLKSENRARKALKTISVILGAFAACWTPYHVIAIIASFCPTCINVHLYMFSYFLCYLNSPINPFCYAASNQQFKNAFKRIMKGDLTMK
jgi:hypothetical protein